jgi:hypothetical protein
MSVTFLLIVPHAEGDNRFAALSAPIRCASQASKLA